jgi:hypothetical protein
MLDLGALSVPPFSTTNNLSIPDDRNKEKIDTYEYKCTIIDQLV